ncbi:MAG TPA: T9SS type A sorting domain-containing protein, partial [Bacteroidia bacterium]|nr:T9SS type A sorting domain-containing protein [Bacteroidia bacterium]
QPAGAATSGANNTFELTRSGIPWLSPFAVVDNTTPLGIPTSEIDGAYTLYPNPASDFVVIEVNNPANDAYKYEVFDATGRSVMIFQNTNSRTEIDLTSLSEGYYFIKATNLTDNSFITERVVKK